MTLQIETIGGNCPVQAEGTIDGVPFYFRARGRRWSMGIGGDPVGEPEWLCQCSWGDGPGDNRFAAGWMSEVEALRLIEWCAAEYAANALRIAPEAPPAAVLALEATTGTQEGEIGASGQEIGSTRDAGSGGAP